MGELCKSKSIRVIRGDILEVYFEIEGIAPEIIKRVCFRNDTVNLYTELPYSQIHEAYCLRIESECTDHFPPSFGSYDLTVELIDGNILTVVHEGEFTVLKKRNEKCMEA